MKITTQLRLSAGSLAVGLALASSPAFAQDEEAQDADITTANETLPPTTNTITVTGSRIERTEFEETSPTFIIGEEMIEDRQFNNVADAINEIPFFGVPGQSRTGTIGNADVGQNFVNFFGLGSQRTLTVVNGRRFVAANAPTVFNNAAPGLQVDLNVIPSSMVERLETVTIRGAPIYGSDAISGTVNVILKNDYEGLEIGGSYGLSEFGDAEDYRVNTIVGGNFADGRGNITLGLEYQEVNGLLERDRFDYIGAGFSFQPNPDNTGGDDGIPDRVLIRDAAVSFATFDGIPALFFGNPFFGVPISDANTPIYTFAPNGNLRPFDTGTRFGAVFADGGDGVRISDINTLSSGVRRTIAAANADYEVTDNIRAFAEFNFANTQGQDLGSQAVWNTDFFSDDGGAIQFNVQNPFLSDQAAGLIQDTCDANGLTDPDDCNFLMARYGRTLTEGENRTAQNLYRIVFGFDGEFELGDRAFNWELAYNYGRTENNSNVRGVNSRRFSNALNVVELTQSDIDNFAFPGATIVRNGTPLLLDVSQLQPGDIACAATVNPPTPAGTDVSIPEQASQSDAALCVPLNYFGEQNTSPEARDYVQQFFGSDTVIDQKVFTASVGGEIFDLPGGGVSVVIGYEHRDEFAQFIPDSGVATGLQQGTIPIARTEGGFSTDEFFAETLIPIIGFDNRLGPISSLIAEGAFRYVDNSRSGGGETWTAGGRLGLFDDQFIIRGNFTRAIRSPALVELFLPQSATNSFANDPCDPTNIDGGTGNRRANCEAEAAALGVDLDATFDNDGDGVVDPFQSVIINGTRQGLVSGNQNLSNEVSDSYTVGGLFQPNFIPGLTLGVDYVNIKIDDAIANLNLTSVTQACYDGDPGTFPNEFCGRFTRGSASAAGQEIFQIQPGFQTGFENAGFRRFQGVTAQLSYANDVAAIFGSDGDLGRLNLSGQLFHLIQDDFSVTGFDLNVQEDEIGRSNWRGQLNVNWDFDDFGILWQTRFVDGAKFSNDDSDEARDFLSVGNYWLFNLGLRAQVEDRIEVRFNIDNVFDNNPPFPSGASGNQGFAYDILGRYYRVGAKVTF
jgi:iron complex outermembrane recepter protein